MPMKILSFNDGSLTNGEVHEIIQHRYATRIHMTGVEYAERNWVERKLLKYCQQQNVAPVAHIHAFMEAIDEKGFVMTQEEVLQFVNLRPTQMVDVYLILDNCSERLTDAQVEELLELVHQTMPLPAPEEEDQQLDTAAAESTN